MHSLHLIGLCVSYEIKLVLAQLRRVGKPRDPDGVKLVEGLAFLMLYLTSCPNRLFAMRDWQPMDCASSSNVASVFFFSIRSASVAQAVCILAGKHLTIDSSV
ncbi:unnamed protein product [Echinostoma caproni]|uniref:Transposase n=1 Tax=Echinostoma caproni TaxID=27848 RepID=A0A183BGD7_9TREM|nr:unnamed protein product [Echinostoma caproni]